MLKRLLLFFAFMPAVAANAQQKPDAGGNYLFVENKGQVADDKGNPAAQVLFSTQKAGVKLFLTKTGLSYQWEEFDVPSRSGTDITFDQLKLNKNKARWSSYRVVIELEGANPNPVIEKHNPADDELNYYLAHCPQGITGIKHYEKVVYKNVYPGIDWVWYNTNGQVKYDFVVNPGADYSQIRLKVNGAAAIKLDEKGRLNIKSPLGEITEDAPLSLVNGEKVESRFTLNNEMVAFSVGNYDKSKALVIDPLLVWCTYYGGTVVDYIYDMAVDKDDNIVVAGSTYSTANISTSGSLQKSLAGNSDGFIAKFDKEGKRLWATYFGGVNDEEFFGISVDDSANIVACGYTNNSPGLATKGSHQDTVAGGFDGLLLKLTSAGNMRWSSYYGGKNDDIIKTVTLDKYFIYIGGTTESTTNIAINGLVNSLCGTKSAFAARLYAGGSRQWGTYYCGSGGFSEGSEIGLDNLSNIYFSGITSDTSGVAAGGFKNTYSGGKNDVFLVKFNPGCVRLWATYYGGTKDDYAGGIAVGPTGEAYLAGYTNSPAGIAFNGYHNNFSDSDDIFIVKFDSACARQWGTYYGGRKTDKLFDICLDTDSTFIIGGTTQSDTGIAKSGWIDTISFINDGVFSRFDKAGKLIWGSYFGADDNDDCYAVAAQSNGLFYIGGYTESKNQGSFGHQNTKGGQIDGFLARFFHTGFPFSPIIKGVKSCDTGILSLTAQPPNGPFNVLWFNDTIQTSPIFTGDTLTQHFTQKDTFWVAINYDNKVFGQRFPVIADVNHHPRAGFVVSNNNQCMKGNNFTFTDTSKYYAPALANFWDFGDGTTLTANTHPSTYYTNPATFKITLVVTDSAQCRDTLIQFINVNPDPKVVFGANQATQCLKGNAYNFTNSSSIAFGSIHYNWNFGNGQSSTVRTPVYTYPAAGKYKVILKVTSDLGCSDTASYIATVITSPTAGFVLNNAVQCFGSNFFLATDTSHTPNPGTPKYLWDFGDAAKDSTQSPGHTYKSTGSFVLKQIVTDSTTKCRDTAMQLVRVLANPQAGFTVNSDSLCFPGNLFVFTNTTVKGTGNLTKFKWSFGDFTGDTIASPTHSYDVEGLFTAKMIAYDDSGCADSAKMDMAALELPVASFTYNNSILCPGMRIPFTSNSTAPFGETLSYQWDFGDGNFATGETPLHGYKNGGTYTPKLTASTAFGCKDDTTLTITLNTAPVASVMPPANACQGAGISFAHNSTVSSGSISSVKWFFGNGDSSVGNAPVYAYPLNGNYTYLLIAYTDKNCTDTARRSLVVNPRPVPVINGSSTAILNKVGLYNTPFNANWQYNWIPTGGVVYAGGSTNTASILFKNTIAKVGLQVTDALTTCKSDTVEKAVSVTADGIGNVNKVNIDVYPNPVINALHIETLLPGSYTITDAGGKLVKTGEIESNAVLDISQFAAGTYFLSFTVQNGQTGVYKFVKAGE